MDIRRAELGDADDIAGIYNEAIRPDIYAASSQAPISTANRETWLKEFFPPFGAYVYEDDNGTIVGWAALNPFPVRECYRKISEISVYVKESHRSKGVGLQLLVFLIERAKQLGFTSLMGIMYEKNIPSISGVVSAGFNKCATFEKISFREDKLQSVVWVHRDLRDPDEPPIVWATKRHIARCL